MSSERDVHSTLQGAILGLTRFWTQRGCLLLPGCDFEVSAGTLHPETFFRLLEADPWRATYVQPVRRPLDGRRRDHPFRFLKHLQLQVVLKPAPRDVRSLYIESLEALGCRLAVHDLRFAEWRWESQVIDGWGSGWRVLIDGLGVTRLTFLQQAAGRELDPVTVELSYGLGRLAMVLGDLPAADDVLWGDEGPTYGDLRRGEESQLSRYVFEIADADTVVRELDAAASEAERCLAAGLARPAYERALGALRGIDLLEARGALSAPDRDRWSAKVRKLVGAAAALHLGEPPATEDDPAAANSASSEPEAGANPGAEKGDSDGKPSADPPTNREKKSKKRAKQRRGGTDGG